jgi:hypothetical protein
MIQNNVKTANYNMQQNEQKEDENVDILAKEIGSWNNYKYALREENRLLFNKMLIECKENEDYIKAANCKDEFFSAESLFMVLILQQQKMINELIAKVSERKKRLGKLIEWMDSNKLK